MGAVTKTGTEGVNGAVGTLSSPDGGDGTIGGNIAASNINKFPADADNSATATGGDGGNGGGGTGGSEGQLGTGGSGESGGSADATVQMGGSFNGDDTNADATATGGDGGDGGAGATGTGPQAQGGDGAAAGNATATATNDSTISYDGQHDSTADAIANGGAGGIGNGAGPTTAGLGGTAKATATDVNNIGTSVAEATATAGGSGFDFDTNGLAGVKATASATATGHAATSVANAFGGGGGTELESDTGTSGNGTGATVTSSATGVTYANASANAYGGNGGGYTGAFFGAGTGGNGASITLDNAATGTTQGGTLTLEQDASGGGGGLSIGAAGGNGGNATSTLNDDDVANATANQSANITLTSIALAGAGGNADATPGKAGAAAVTDDVSAAATTTITLNASATGGYGGSATTDGNGVVGGKASAVAADGTYNVDNGDTTGTSFMANITASAAGRAGGNAVGAGNVGGAGGVATAKTIAIAVNTVTVETNVQGGGGGDGTSGANGGNGAAENLNNDAIGVNSTSQSIDIFQNAYGGYGGSSDTGKGGIGGEATADQNASASTAAVFVLNEYAQGGNGGVSTPDANGGAAGAATANGTATGTGEVNINATADGGQSETKGGAATATLNATGHSSYSTAEAVAGGSEAAGAKATATAAGDATTGTLEALANSSPHIINTPLLIDEISSKSTISLYGSTATTEAISAFDSGLPAVTGSPVGIALGIAAPTGTAAILTANHNIQLAFGPHPTVFEIGELGGGYSGPTGVTQTETSSITETLDLAKLTASGNFALGLYDGAITDAAGVSQVVLTVTNTTTNNTLFSATYTGAEALNAFTSDLAPTLNNPAFTNSGSATIEVSLGVTTTAAGAGFTGDFIFGDPPQTQTIDVENIAGRAYTSAEKTFTDGVLTSVAQYSSPGHLLQDVAISHNVGAFGTTGLSEAIQTNIAGSTNSERDVYRDAAGHNEIVVSHLAGGALDIDAHASGLVFNLGASFGTETIQGFGPDSDALDISHTLFSSFTEMMSHAEQQGHNVVIAYDTSDVLTLTGVTLGELNAHASDFHFI